MRVSELFFSLQGEGVNIGQPAVFLRLAGCNLRCRWCDSKYTWSNGEDWSLDETLGAIQSHRCRRLVITGGEPLLQEGDVAGLLERLPDHAVEIETNGTILPRKDLLSRAQLNVSPKLASSGQREGDRWKPEVLEALARRKRAYFKFVVDGVEELAELESIVGAYGVPSERVILMPQGVDEESIAAKARELVEFCKERGYRLLPRLHVTLFGNRRGV